MNMDLSTSPAVALGRPYDSAAPVTNGLSISSSSNISTQQPSLFKASMSSTSDDHSLSELEDDKPIMHPALVSNEGPPPQEPHIIQLSAIEHCMPRAYIRICLAYRLPENVKLDDIVEKLNKCCRKLVDAKPYLAGYVVPAPNSKSRVGLAEIRFTDDDFLSFPDVEVRYLRGEGKPFDYDELDRNRLPPSVIRPELVSSLPEGTDDERAPAFRMQANIADGGIIVSVYLHHCISDGTGLGFLLTGAVLHDELAFHRYLESNGLPTPSLNMRLAAFANRMTIVRQKLSWSEHNQISDRLIQHRTRSSIGNKDHKSRPNGRGCLVAFSREKLDQVRSSLETYAPRCFRTPNDILQAILWHHMTKARIPSVRDAAITRSKLLIPVNIRNKLKEPLSDSYFGAAVDFATAELPLARLSSPSPAALADTALTIRHAINGVNEAYVRQAIALSLVKDPDIDVRDLMGSNMNRTDGADMYITSWERLGLYDATLDLGLGRPDWIRKPWSKDPGSCIVMPSDDRKPYLEVLVQMTEPDLERLLLDDTFMSYVVGTID